MDLHSVALEELCCNPTLIGLEFEEYDFLKELPIYYGGKIIIEPDIIFQTKSGVYIVEYKCCDSPKSRAKAICQLRLCHQIFHPKESIYVWGSYECERIGFRS